MQKGFFSLIMVLPLILLATLIGGYLITKSKQESERASTKEEKPAPTFNLQPLLTPTPLPNDYEPTKTIIPSPTIKPPTKLLTPTGKLIPTPTPTPTPLPTPTPTPLPKPLCSAPTIYPTNTGAAPFTATFQANAETGSAGGIVGYEWDFQGDGTWDTPASLDAPTYTYQNPGIYTVKMRVLATNGQYSDICQNSITVLQTP